MNTPDVIDENPYLALRAAKIARNNDKLQELGLLKPPSKSGRRRQPPTENGPKRPTLNRRVERPQQQPTRRSTRNRQSPDEKDDALSPVAPESILPSRKRRLRTTDSPTETTGVRTKSTVAYVFAANSVRRIEISVSELVNKFLGRTMAKTGKACVIQTTLGGMDASFNKYSGVQEWGNDAIYLWVNLDNPGKNDVVNDFPQNGRQLTWFGGSRMHDDTPVIQKLVRVGRQSKMDATTASANGVHATTKPAHIDGGGIVLWCRHYNRDAKTYHPYTCLGRLSYESHVPGSQPLEFIWNLLDYDHLVQHEDREVRARFQDIISR